MKCKYEGSGVWEGRCVGTKEVDPCIGIEKCDRYKPDCQTNADRIRAMSDEELAKLIVKHKPLYSWCKGVREIWMKPNVTKVQAWLEWLNQPADGQSVPNDKINAF